MIANETGADFKEGLMAYLNALETAKKELKHEAMEAPQTIKRIATSLSRFDDASLYPEIGQAVALIEKATVKDYPRELERLLSAIKVAIAVEKSEKVKILIIEDELEICSILEDRLRDSHRDLALASTVAEAEKLLAMSEVSLILLDLGLPDSDGRNFLMRLRQSPLTSRIPVIVLTAHAGNFTKRECFALGADEFLEKPFDLETLSIIVSSKLQRSTEMFRESRKDHLTGLLNRTAFYEAFSRCASFAIRLEESLAIAIIDLDYFKSINDTYGHLVGDEVLRSSANIIAKSLRKSDILARWGGDEFIVLFPNTNLEVAVHALNRTLKILTSTNFQGSDGKTFQISFSAGATLFSKEDTFNDIVGRADQLLYHAKREERERVVTK